MVKMIRVCILSGSECTGFHNAFLSRMKTSLDQYCLGITESSRHAVNECEIEAQSNSSFFFKDGSQINVRRHKAYSKEILIMVQRVRE